MNVLVTILMVVAWFGVVFWRRSVTRRKRWLRRLNLPGTWNWQDGDSSLSLSGELSAGSYLLREAGTQSSGRWRLLGHSLELFSTRGDLQLGQGESYVFDVRRFDTGTLGLDAPGREKRVYKRSSENVVPLRGS